MSFLDNLERNLKTLEDRQERSPSTERSRREAERANNAAIAPWAERLKKSQFTATLLDTAVAAGHERRAKVYILWLGSTLRLELRDRRLDLKPTPTGVIAAFCEGGVEQRTAPVDLDGNPVQLVREWLA